MEMTVTPQPDGLRLVHLNGRLDLLTAEKVAADFLHHCEGEHVRMLVDLANVTFIASTGFRLLLNGAKMIASQGGRLAFINPSASLRDVLEVIGVLTIIPVYEDVESARQALVNI